MSFTTYIIPESAKKQTLQIEKWLWIVTKQPFSAEQEELIQKICLALKAEFPREVHHLICQPTEPISLFGMFNSHPSLIISFGISPASLGIFIDLNSQGIRFLEPYSFILTSTLDELMNQPVAKKQLWSSMQAFMKQSEKK